MCVLYFYASLSNYTYQINNTVNACVKYIFVYFMYCCDDELLMLKSKYVSVQYYFRIWKASFMSIS